MTITCPGCGASMPASFKFCSNCGRRLQEVESDRIDASPESSGASFGIPGASFDSSDASRQAERRQITVMFCDLVGSVKLSNQLDPEDLRDIIHRYQEAATGVVERWEGYVAQYLGDGILIYFGYPVAHEGEAERAVRAGLEILKKIRSLRRKLQEEHNVEIAVRLGLHTGLVVVGEVGSGLRRENLALGETPNVAARLQAIAPPNGIAVSEATYRQISGSFECTDLGLKAIQGLPREERVYEIREERLDASPLDLHRARGPIGADGRESELETFRTSWKTIEEGTGSALTIFGEAGIGKSHVIQLFRQELAAVPHFRVECRCSPYGRSSALHPITDWLHRVLNFYPEQPPGDRLDMIEFVAERSGLADPEVVALFATLLSVPLDERFQDPGYSPALRREKTEALLVDFILKIRDDLPLVLIVEDIHWADPSTKAFLGRFAAHLRDTPILVLLTSRPRPEMKWPDDVSAGVLHLRRRSKDQVEAIISHVAGKKRLPADIVAQIVQRTDGVPLFVQELSRTILESGLVVESEECFELAKDGPELSIPATLQDSLMSRLDRLLPVKEVAQLCSVLGREFTFDLARAATRLPEAALASALEKLASADILVADGAASRSRYMFRHALLQEAAYESLLRRIRIETHARVGEHLVRTADADEARPEIIAHHFTRAGMRDQAAEYWLRAGQNAQERWANEEALDYFGRGAALLEGVSATTERDRLRFLLSAGLAVASLQIRGYTHPSVLSAFEKARTLADRIDDVAASIPILRGMWMHYTVLADHRRAEDLAIELTRISTRAEDPIYALEAEIARASTAFWRGRVREARQLYEEILARYQGAEDRPPSTMAAQHPSVNALSYLSLALWYLGFPEDALQRSAEAVAIADRFQHPFSQALATTFQTALYSYFGDRDRARESSQRAVEISRRFGYPYWLAISTMTRAWASALDDPEAAIGSMKQGLGALRSVGARIWTGYPSALLADLLAERGDLEEALRLIDGVVEQAESCDENYFLPEILRIRSRLLVGLDRTDEADGVRVRALALAHEQSAAPILKRIEADTASRSTPAAHHRA